MARTQYGTHTVAVTGSDDVTKQVSKNAWNAAHSQAGMFGHDASNKTIASGALTPVSTLNIVAGEGGLADNLDYITYGATPEVQQYDYVKLISDAQTITVRHNQGSVPANSGAIFTLGGVSKILSTTVEMVLQRIGTSFYEVVPFNAVITNAVQVVSNKVFDSTNTWGDSTDNTKAVAWTLSGATTGKTLTLISSHTDNRSVTFPNVTSTLAILGANTFTADQTMTATKKIILGNANSFIVESSANVLDINAGASQTNLLRLQDASIQIDPTNHVTTFGLNVIPLATFHALSSGTANSIFLFDKYNDTGDTQFRSRRAGGTVGTPTATATNINLLSFAAHGYDGSGFVEGGSFSFRTTQQWASGSGGTKFRVFVTPNSTATSVDSFEIQQNGDIAMIATAKFFYDGVSAAGNTYRVEQGADDLVDVVGGIQALELKKGATTTTEVNVVVGRIAAMATTVADGFLYIPTCAGTPTGTPTTFTGKAALIYDVTNKIIYLYNFTAAAWQKTAALT